MTIADSKQAPIVDRLRQLLRDGSALSSNSDPKGSEVESWAMRVLSEMQIVYGDDSSAVRYFPSTAFDDPTLTSRAQIAERLVQLERFLKELDAIPAATIFPLRGNKIFIGHGRSLQWLRLKEFITERLALPCEEFNVEPKKVWGQVLPLASCLVRTARRSSAHDTKSQPGSPTGPRGARRLARLHASVGSQPVSASRSGECA